MSRVRAVAVFLVAVVLLVLVVVRLTADNGTPRRPKDITALEIGASAKVRWSPDGARIVVVEGGTATVVGVADARVVMRTGTNIVDATWMPDSRRILVVEGPIPTGQVSTVDMRGKVDGNATLDPSIGFGNGEGIAVDERGTRAALIAVTRDAIGGAEHTDLAIVELQSGTVRVYPTARKEARPLFADDGLVVVASHGTSTVQRLDLVDVATGSVRAGRPIVDGPYGLTFGGQVIVARRAAQGAYRLTAVNTVNRGERTLHVTKPHRHVVAVNAQATRCLVRVFDKGGTSHLVIESFG